MFIAAQLTIAKYWKQPKCPSANEWIKKLWYIYTMELYAAERKKELIPFATAWMELESIMHRPFLMKRTEQGTQREQPRAVEKQSMVRVKITPQSFSIAHKLTLKFWNFKRRQSRFLLGGVTNLLPLRAVPLSRAKPANKIHDGDAFTCFQAF